MHTQTHRDMNHDEACGICGGGDTIGCKVEEHKCGYNADVARPAFAAIGLLITIGVVCSATAVNNAKTDSEERQPMLPQPTNPAATNPVSQPVASDLLIFGAIIQMLNNQKADVFSRNPEDEQEIQLKKGDVAKIERINYDQILVKFGERQVWLRKNRFNFDYKVVQ